MGHLPVDPNAPFLVKAAADTLLWSHIGGGSIGIASGFVATFAKKGGRWHRWAGTTFFGSMLVMAGIGAVVAPFLGDHVSSIAGVMTLYLVLTGWSAARRRDGGIGWLEYGGLAAVLCVGAADVVLWQMAMHNPHLFPNIPKPAYYVIGLLVAISAGSDINVIRQGGVIGAPQRTARHLWRMLTALLIAEGSGLPRLLDGYWLAAPLLLVFGVLIYWLARSWMLRWRARARRAQRQGGVAHA